MRLNNEHGLTLIEVVTVVALIGLLAAIAIPNFLNWLPNMRLKEASRDLYSLMQKARLEAAQRNQPVVLVFTPVACMAPPVTSVPSPGGGYQVFVDDGGGVPANAGNFSWEAGEQVLNTMTMPANVALCSTAFTLGATAIGFTPKGLPAGNRSGSATISNDRGRSYVLNLSTAGFIQLQ